MIAKAKKRAAPVRHIGFLSLCDAVHRADSIMRTDLGAARYKRLGVSERFKGEKPYRVCKRCIACLSVMYSIRARTEGGKP